MNKTKTSIIILSILLIATLSIVIFKSNKNKGNRKNAKDFAVENIYEISKISLTNISDSVEHQILLTKENDFWRINGRFVARPEALSSLLQIIGSVQLKSLIPAVDILNIKTKLQTHSVKIEVFSGENLKKCYFVGDLAANKSGTYMLMENGERPYIMFLPGLSNELLPYYSVSEYYWKDNTIFKYNPDQISSISVQYSIFPEKSFVLKRNNKDVSFKLFNNNNVDVSQSTNIETIKRYLSYFSKVKYETPANLDLIKRKKIISKIPFYIITVKANGVTNYISTYRKVRANKQDTIYKKSFDFDRMYGKINDDSNLVVLKYVDFDPVAKEIEYFKK